MNDTQSHIGKLIQGKQDRDAIHIAVSPAIAGESLRPGQHVGFVESGTGRAVGACETHIGIVDPYLTERVAVGQKFWLFMYPNTITGLRHHWTHAALDNPSKVWIEQFANDALDMTYSQLMQAAEDWVENEEYTTQYGSDRWRDTFPSYAAEFWKHYEVVTGKRPSASDDSFFSCSC